MISYLLQLFGYKTAPQLANEMGYYYEIFLENSSWSVRIYSRGQGLVQERKGKAGHKENAYKAAEAYVRNRLLVLKKGGV